MLAIQGWTANIIIPAMGTTIILMLLFLCLKSSQTHKKHDFTESQGLSDICERMSRMWPWAPQPPSPEQSIIGSSCSEGMVEEVIEKGKVTSVAVQIPTICKEEREAERCINQHKYYNKEDASVYKSDNHQIENQLPDHAEMYLNPNSHENILRNVNYHQGNVPSNTIGYFGSQICYATQSENAQKEYVRIMKPNVQQQNICWRKPNMSSTLIRPSGNIEQQKSPEQPSQYKPLAVKLEYPGNQIYSPIKNSHSSKQSDIQQIPPNTFPANTSFGYIPLQKVEPNKIIIMGQNVAGHNSQTRNEAVNNKGVPVIPNKIIIMGQNVAGHNSQGRYEPINSKGVPLMPNRIIIMGENVSRHNSPSRCHPITNKDVPVIPKFISQEPATGNKYNNLQHVPMKITQKKPYDNFTVKNSNQENPPLIIPQFKVQDTGEEITTGKYSPHQSQIRPHPIRLENTNNQGREPEASETSSESGDVIYTTDYTKRNVTRSSSDEQFPKIQKNSKFAYQDLDNTNNQGRQPEASETSSESGDVKYTTDDTKPNVTRSSSDEQFPKIQKNSKFAYQDPVKFVQRSVSDELPLRESFSRRVSVKSVDNWTETDILDISTSNHKPLSISSREINLIPIGSLHSSEKSKEKIIKQLSQFSSLFPEDPKNPVPKDPLTLPLDKNFERTRMSNIQLSEKISEIGSKSETGRAKFKSWNNNSNYNDVNKIYTLFNFRKPKSLESNGHKSNETMKLNRDCLPNDSSKSHDNIEINIHQTELDNFPSTERCSNSVERITEKKSIELYTITIPSSDESLNQKQRGNKVDEVNKGKKCNSLEILCANFHSGDDFTNKAISYVDAINQPTLTTAQSKTSKCPTKKGSILQRYYNIQEVPPKNLHSEELCCLQLSSSSKELFNSIVTNKLDDYGNNNQEMPSVVTNNTFQQCENLYNEHLKSNSTVGTSHSEQLKDSVVFYNKHFNNNTSSDIFMQSIPVSDNHVQSLTKTSTPELTRKRQSDSKSKRKNYKSNTTNKAIATTTALQNGETSNLPKIAAVLKWRIVMEKSNPTK